ncbi:hypothetical protein ALC60_05991 [Trachymyrmex zeteki]|uniref:Uncharacterized protein n=1 Tax=Mycetomoellerius zeteki TaxID=64791 RepID=A0A151X4D0_9HYME|nr:hypothetical protein ALC60_05991 [Trachymyrmex zeteki]
MTEFLGENDRSSLRRGTGWIGHRPTNPSPSAYGEWPGRINRKAGISFRRCGSVVPRLAVAEAPPWPQPTSQIIVHVMGHAHRIEPTGNNKVEGGLSKPIYGD